MGETGMETRRLILRAALDLFSVDGYARTSLREIAEKVGISKPALYYHFGSKEDLLVEIVRPLQDAMAELLDRAEAADPPPTGRDFFTAYFDVVMEHRQLSVWLSMDNAPRAHPALTERGWAQQERLIKLLRGDDDSFERSVEVACALGAMQVGIMTFATLGGLDQAREHILGAALRLLEGGRSDA
ncbi:MAG: TetR family transcriptional regulator [Actinobacteria bacterium]|nr:TetR family transcriptional regulator [Actinomycetota bacterium]